MLDRLHAKLNNRRGIAWLIVIVILLILVVVAIMMLPTIERWRYEATEAGCIAQLDTARRQLANESMLISQVSKESEARDFIASVQPGWDDLCPGGGTTYIVPTGDETPYLTVICGMHGTDRKQCTRLNADYVLRQLRENLTQAQKDGDPIPNSLPFFLNGKKLTATRVDADPGIRRGTDYIIGMDGIQVFYGLRGTGDFTGPSKLKDGEICAFWFADKEYCAIWRTPGSWTGDSWS